MRWPPRPPSARRWRAAPPTASARPMQHRNAAEEAKRALAELRRRHRESDALLARVRELWADGAARAKKREKSRPTPTRARWAADMERASSALHAAASPAALGLPEPVTPLTPLLLAPGTGSRH